MNESTTPNVMDARNIGRLCEVGARILAQEADVTDLDALRYPVGRFERLTQPIDRSTRDAHLSTLEAAPARFRALVAGLSDAELDTPYRPGGWTIRQVVHHVPDSHMNAYIRVKLAVTEEMPTVKTYHEDLWAELPDGKSGSIRMSLDLLDALHRRWIAFLRVLPESDLQKAFAHADGGRVTIDEAISMHAWHRRHHTAHIEPALASVAQPFRAARLFWVAWGPLSSIAAGVGPSR